MDNHSTGNTRHCDVCGNLCKKRGSALWKKSFRCTNCNIVYYDRSEFNKEATAHRDGGTINDARWRGEMLEEDGV